MNRKIDDLGRIVIPKEMRKQLNMNNGDEVNIEVIDNKITISKANQIDYKQILDEVREDIIFCINGMKNEYACTDKRTNKELHTMVKILEENLQMIDKAK